jgi:subtilisin-like proprotein convertase family protein
MSNRKPVVPGNRAAAAVLVALSALALAAAPASAQFASGNMVYTYENSTSGTIPYTSSDACASGGLVRTFAVPESFTFNSVSLGLNVSHADRGDIRVILAPPGAAATTLFVRDDADTNDNYDVKLSRTNDATSPALNDGTADITTEPYYNRMVYSSVLAASPFTSGTANGTWTLYLCDRDNNGVNGTFNRARLTLTTTAAPANVCTSTALIDWGANGGGDNATGADYPVGGLTGGGVTMTREAYGSDPNGGTTVEANQKTVSTSQFGGTLGYYQMRFTAPTALSAREGTYYWARFRFDPPVRDLQWGSLDVDTGTWEDAVRIYGTDADNLGGNRIPYAMTFVDPANASFQYAGDFVEADSGNVADSADDGNSFALFKGTVRSVRTEYWALDEPATPNTQRIGLSDAQFCAFDYGDAPNTYGTQLSGGARHVLGNRTLYLGTNPPDGEADGAPGAAATIDDTTQIGVIDDEDGVASFPAYTGGSTTYTVSVNAVNLSTTTAGTLVGYIDWNRDGDFADANEISGTVSVPANTTSPTAFNVTWTSVPANAGGTTATYARFRIAYAAAEAQSPTGLANSGEVEDYPISANTLPVTIAHVESAAAGGQLTVRWTTASEWANGGFVVSGRGAGEDAWTMLAEVGAHTPDSMTPKRYEATVDGLGVGEILIEDVSLFGERRAHGPFRVGETVGEAPAAAAIDWAAVKAELAAAPAVRAARSGLRVSAAAAGATEALLLVREEGIHRVTHEQLLAAGVDLSGTPAARINLFDKGKAVARFVSAPGGIFGPGSYVEFVGRPALTLASPVDAYVLRVQRTGVPAVPALPVGAGAVAVVTAEDRYAPDRVYSFSSPNGDPWYDQGLLARGAPAVLTRTFDLPDLAAGPVALTVRSWGYGDWAGTDPDHHVVVSLNGAVIADDRFDGVTPLERTVDVTSLVAPTGNTLEFRVPGDTGYMFDYMAFEGFSVRYPRRAVARAGRLAGTVNGGTGFAVSGFAAGEPVALWRLKGTTWQRAERIATGGEVTVQGSGTLWAAAPAALLTPAISAGVPSPLASSSAQYVIVTHPALAGALGDLVALQQARGLSTEVVTTDSIYAAYSDHATSAEAVRQFLTASFRNRTLKYVLLVGADTTDPYDHLGLGSMTFVPTAYLPFVQYVTFSPTDEALVDVDGDNVGEVPIGRLPARTPAEVQAMVAKILLWEQDVAPSGRAALLSSGASRTGNDFTALNTSYANALDTWTTTRTDVDTMGSAAVRSAVLAALNAGTPLVSYVGHSSIGQWDFTPILKWQDVATLTNAGRPNLVAQWGCWNAYYVEPSVESLSARLMRAPGAGAAAAIGATTLTSESSHLALGTRFYARLNGAPTTVGDAFRAAKIDLLGSGAPTDALLGMALLGDPAMSVPR